MFKKIYAGILCLPAILAVQSIYAQSVATSVEEKEGMKIFSLSNDKVVQQVFIQNDMLAGDILKGKEEWLEKYHNAGFGGSN
jgi:hypothetical protein